MQVANRDMFPTPEMRARFPAITALLTNEPVDAAFNRHEALSVRAKRAYHRLGLASIILISGAAIYTIAETLLFRALAPSWVGILVAIAAALGVGAQIYMLAARLRSVWLVNRFACERLRSIKFQAYALAAGASSGEDLAARVSAFSADELAKLAEEVNAGIAVFENFTPEKLVIRPEPVSGPGDPAILSQARTAYKDLRADYQGLFASSELLRLRQNRRAFRSAADLIYLAGAVLVLLSLLSKVVPGIPISAWVDFFAISCFVASLSKLVLDNASLTEPSAARFVRYREDISRVLTSINSGAGLDVFVPAMERIALGELEQFCDSAKTINYRL